jgi:hypothetical protein
MKAAKKAEEAAKIMQKALAENQKKTEQDQKSINMLVHQEY